MGQSKFRSGRLEFALCIAVPLVALAAILIPGQWYYRYQARELARREAWLKKLPAIEVQLSAAQKALQPFAAAGAESDKAAELTLAVNQAAEASGFAIRSVNVEKQVGAGSDTWTDYSVLIGGEGSLNSIIRMLDSVKNQARLRVARVVVRAKSLVPAAAYGVEMTLLSRNVAFSGKNQMVANAPVVSMAQVEALGARLTQFSDAVKAREQGKESLSLKGLDNRKSLVVTAAPVAAPPTEVSFKLSGIIRDGKRPLAMTDRGVFGVGDEIDEFKIVAITDDKVTVVNKQGRREVLRLYTDKIGK